MIIVIIIGGISFFGGMGFIIGIVFGVMMFVVFNNGLVVINVNLLY